jgi:hypothetical protein
MRWIFGRPETITERASNGLRTLDKWRKRK